MANKNMIVCDNYITHLIRLQKSAVYFHVILIYTVAVILLHNDVMYL